MHQRLQGLKNKQGSIIPRICKPGRLDAVVNRSYERELP